LQVELQGSGSSATVVVADPVSSTPVGTLAGVPNLAVLIQCLEAGVEYMAYVSAVSGGRVDVTVTRQ
jgi:hypothetical protein